MMKGFQAVISSLATSRELLDEELLHLKSLVGRFEQQALISRAMQSNWLMNDT